MRSFLIISWATFYLISTYSVFILYTTFYIKEQEKNALITCEEPIDFLGKIHLTVYVIVLIIAEFIWFMYYLLSIIHFECSPDANERRDEKSWFKTLSLMYFISKSFWIVFGLYILKWNIGCLDVMSKCFITALVFTILSIVDCVVGFIYSYSVKAN